MDGLELGSRSQLDWSTDVWQMCGLTAWEQAARKLPPTQPAQEQSNPTHGGSISTLGGLTICELSVDDERQHSEQDEGNKNWHDNWNNWDENWVQNEMTDGYKIEMTDGHRSWNNKIWYANWVQNKKDNWVCNQLTGHSSELVVKGVGVRSDKKCGQTTCGVDTPACRNVVSARHPAT